MNHRILENLVVWNSVGPYTLPDVTRLSDARTEEIPGELASACYNIEPTDQLGEIKAADACFLFFHKVAELSTLFTALVTITKTMLQHQIPEQNVLRVHLVIEIENHVLNIKFRKPELRVVAHRKSPSYLHRKQLLMSSTIQL